MAHVEIGFGAVVGDVDLAMLERVHRPGIDVDVGIQFLEGDGEPPALEKCPDGGCSEPLAQGGKNAAGDENELGPFAGLWCFHGATIAMAPFFWNRKAGTTAGFIG